jgi:hypothetical protein
MVSLKKNDKIIIIVAVVILVIAGVGVAMYQSPKAPTDYSSLITSEKSFNVTWALRNGTLSSISDFAGKKTPFEGIVTIPEGNVNRVTFNLSWTDDHMTFLKRMGLDRLTLEVSMPDGMSSFSETNTSAPRTGYGTISFTIFKDINPPEGPIKAENAQDAQTKLQTAPFFDDSWTDKDINFNVSVQIGELRFLKKLRDKGNDFELQISYQYYDGTLNEDTTKNTGGGSDMPPEDVWSSNEEPPYISMIINTGCGRFV